VGYLIADSVQMVQVVRNLIENALKYSPKDSLVELLISIKDGAVLIEVADRGAVYQRAMNSKSLKPFTEHRV